MNAYELALAKYEQIKQQHPHTICKHLLQIMSLLLPLRRICSGGVLTEKDLGVPDLDLGDVAAEQSVTTDPNLVAPEEECSICLDNMENPVLTLCNHWFCKECLLGVLTVMAKCPLCR